MALSFALCRAQSPLEKIWELYVGPAWMAALCKDLGIPDSYKVEEDRQSWGWKEEEYCCGLVLEGKPLIVSYRKVEFDETSDGSMTFQCGDHKYTHLITQENEGRKLFDYLGQGLEELRTTASQERLRNTPIAKAMQLQKFSYRGDFHFRKLKEACKTCNEGRRYCVHSSEGGYVGALEYLVQVCTRCGEEKHIVNEDFVRVGECPLCKDRD